ncbi:phosphotransferase [Actinomadura rifamycini]|uniref:phosphotransferase n=1 Tax=Actinomadura rifamycini TaxID=31962 RepID=UPI000427618D|nr:phosphotransferase [Actinomadura rifamycini]
MATYTKVHDVDTAAVADIYGLEGLTLRPLEGGAANSSFKATAEQGSFVLTILDNHDQASAHALAAHTEAMFRLGVPTAEVVRNVEGADVSTITGRPVLLKRWIPGQVVDRLPDELLPAAGELLAHLHGVPPAQVPDLPTGTRRLSPAHRATIEKFPDKAFADWLTHGLAGVEARERRLHDDQVVCHGDVFTDNLIVRPDDTLAVIDWETVSLDGALLDLGMTILGLANVNGALDRHRADLIVTGYNKHRPLSAEQLVALPQEIEHAALIIAFHRYYRHNVRFPDPAKGDLHTEMIDFVESMRGLTLSAP